MDTGIKRFDFQSIDDRDSLPRKTYNRTSTVSSDDEAESDPKDTDFIPIEAENSAKTSKSRSGKQIRLSSSSPVKAKALLLATNTTTLKSKIVKLKPDPIARQNIVSLRFSGAIIDQSLQSVGMPTYRAGGRRQNRTGYVDHDILEGIPVRQWRREIVTVAPPPQQENNASQNDIWASELPWGMPKDSHLLPQHSQDLLRAARSGRIYKRPAPMDEEEQDVEVGLADKPDKKEDETRDSGFTARAWKQIPGHQNASDMDFLAKRRKGLGSTVPKPAPIPTVVQTTVRRTDAAGNEYLEKVIVRHGQTVEGDVVSQTTIPDPSATVEGTPFRRKGPVGKKGKRGPGRGRKKIIPTSTPNVTSEPSAQNGDASNSNVGVDGIKIEGEGSATPFKNLDTEMIDDSNPASDDDDGEEGDQGDEDDDSSDVLNSPSRPHRDSSQDHNMPIMQDIPKLSNTDVTMGGIDNYEPTKSELERVKDEGKFGSPLKQIALTTSTINTPMVSPTETTAREPIMFASGNADISSAPIEKINQEMLSVAEVSEVSAPIDVPPVPPHPTKEHEEVSMNLRAEEEEEEEMLLDILEHAENSHFDAAIPMETESPAPAVPASMQSHEELSNSPTVEAKSPQIDMKPSPVPAVEEPSPVLDLAMASTDPPTKEEEQPVALTFSASPVKEEEQPVALHSPRPTVQEFSEPAESTEPIKPTEPTEPAEFVESIEPAVSTEQTEPTDQTESKEQIAPIEPTEEAESMEQIAPTEPTEKAESIEHIAPTEPTEQTESIEQIAHTEQIGTEHPGPTEQIETADPIVPTEPTALVGPDKSIDPEVPNEPNVPAEPINPTNEEEDDDFLDLLGGLERNLYGNSQPPATPSGPAAPAASVPSKSPERIEPLPQEVESNANAEEKEEEEKGEEIKEEIKEELKEEASTS